MFYRVAIQWLVKVFGRVSDLFFPFSESTQFCTQLAATESFLALCQIFYSGDEIIKSLFWDLLDLPSPLDCKEIQPVHSEGDQPWDFFGRNDAKAETPVLWPRHAKSWLIGKDSDAGRDRGQEEKGTT